MAKIVDAISLHWATVSCLALNSLPWTLKVEPNGKYFTVGISKLILSKEMRSRANCKTAVTPLLTHLSYCSLALRLAPSGQSSVPKTSSRHVFKSSKTLTQKTSMGIRLCVCFTHSQYLNELSLLQWRHNGRDDVSNHRCLDCLLNRLFSRRSKKTSKLRVNGLCDRWPVNSPHKGPVTRKMFHLMTSSCADWHCLWKNICNMIQSSVEFILTHFFNENVYIF